MSQKNDIPSLSLNGGIYHPLLHFLGFVGGITRESLRGEFEFYRENFGTGFMDSTCLPCSDDDEWLDPPRVRGNDNHVRGRGGGIFITSQQAICRNNVVPIIILHA